MAVYGDKFSDPARKNVPALRHCGETVRRVCHGVALRRGKSPTEQAAKVLIYTKGNVLLYKVVGV